MYSRKSYVGGGRGPAEAAGEGEQTEEEEAGGTGSRPGPEAGSWVWLRGGPRLRLGGTRGPRGGVWSLRGLAGQLLLVEAHDVVHELVLLARLDHPAPARQMAGPGHGRTAAEPPPDPQSAGPPGGTSGPLCSLQRSALASLPLPPAVPGPPSSGIDSGDRGDMTLHPASAPLTTLFLSPLHPSHQLPESGFSAHLSTGRSPWGVSP